MPMPLTDMTGKRIGSLTVVGVAPRKGGDSHARWMCLCDCGRRTEAAGNNLRRGSVKSCGCLKAAATSHGEARRGRKSAEYQVWVSIQQRCTNPKNKAYANYGGRGIRMCHRWANSYSCFLADVGKRPSHRHSLDRWPDLNGDYEPTNVRWATAKEQALNTRRVLIVSMLGRALPLSAAIEAIQLPLRYGTMLARIKRGMSFEEAACCANRYLPLTSEQYVKVWEMIDLDASAEDLAQELRLHPDHAAELLANRLMWRKLVKRYGMPMEKAA